MGSFTPGWLALRQAADHQARSARRAEPIADVLPSSSDLAVLDLAAGTGSNVRYLARRLVRHRRQHWLLVDRDAALLARAQSDLAGDTGLYRIETRRVDLASIENGDTKSLFTGQGLVTASALCDLVSDDWLRAITNLCASHRAAVLFALNYDGQIACTPAHEDDEWIRDLVNEHQRRDKGLGGVALGPQAAASIEKSFTHAGFTVRRGRSDWMLQSDSRALQRALIDGWAQAATEMAPTSAARIDGWRRGRMAH